MDFCMPTSPVHPIALMFCSWLLRWYIYHILPLSGMWGWQIFYHEPGSEGFTSHMTSVAMTSLSIYNTRIVIDMLMNKHGCGPNKTLFAS